MTEQTDQPSDQETQSDNVQPEENKLVKNVQQGQAIKIEIDNPDKFQVTHTVALKVAYGFAIVFLALIFVDPNKFLIEDNPLKGSVAIVKEKQSEVKVKHPRGATWSSLKQDDKLYPNSMIYTGPSSSVVIVLTDNTVIKQGAESLLRLKIVKKFKEKKTDAESAAKAKKFLNALDKKLVDEGAYDGDSGIDLELDGGNIKVATSENSKVNAIKTRDANLKVSGGSELNMQNTGDLDTKIEMIQGGGELSTLNTGRGSISLKKNQKISTKKVKESDTDDPEELVEKTASATNMSSGFGEKYEIKKKGVWETLKEMGRIILFRD